VAVTAGTTLIAPFQSVPHVANPKKWWPGYLTVKRPATKEPKDAQTPSKTQPDEEHLEKAVKESVSPKVSPSNEPTIDTSVNAKISSSDVGQGSHAEAMELSTETWDVIWEYPPLPSSPLVPSFSESHIHLSSKGDEYRTEKRKVIQVSNHGIILVVLLDHQSEVDLHAIRGNSVGYHDTFEDFIAERMYDLRIALNQSKADKSLSELLLPPITSVPSQFILYDSESKTTLTSKPSYLGDESQILFSAQDAFEKPSEPLRIIEYACRTSSNQWYASRLTAPDLSQSKSSGAHEMKAGAIVHLDAGNTQGSLIDVDAELGVLGRRMAEK